MPGRTKQPRNQANASRMTTRAATVSGKKRCRGKVDNGATTATKRRNTSTRSSSDSTPRSLTTADIPSIVSAVVQALPTGQRNTRTSWQWGRIIAESGFKSDRRHQQNDPRSSQDEESSTITRQLNSNADHDANPESGHNNPSPHDLSKLTAQYSIRLHSLATIDSYMRIMASSYYV